jgi:hypothetical protein
MISAGSSAHADHGLVLAEALKDASTGETADFPLRDSGKLKEIAARLGLAVPSHTDDLDGTFRALYGASFVHDPDPLSQATRISSLVEEKRTALSSISLCCLPRGESPRSL